jgi:hypothetical protein
MAKNIIVSLDGEESSFGFKAVDRSSLYGKRRRIALDKDGNPCTRGSLLEDGSLLLKSGMSGQGYFLDDGTFLKQSDLEGFDINGNARTTSIGWVSLTNFMSHHMKLLNSANTCKLLKEGTAELSFFMLCVLVFISAIRASSPIIKSRELPPLRTLRRELIYLICK